MTSITIQIYNLFSKSFSKIKNFYHFLEFKLFLEFKGTSYAIMFKL